MKKTSRAKKPSATKKTSATKKASKRQGSEWVGGRRISPIFIGSPGEDEYRPDIVLWLDTADDFILHVNMVMPQESDEVIADGLIESFESANKQSRRPPSSLRVDSPELAAMLREHLALPVRVAATPELDEVISEMRHDFANRPEAEPSYLEDGEIPAPVVEHCFNAAAALYRLAPWRHMDDDALLEVHAPFFGLDQGCLSIIGALGESFGLVLFQSMAGFHSMTEFGSTHSHDAEIALAEGIFSLEFVARDDTPPSLLAEIERHGWTLAAPDAVPVVRRFDADGVGHPLCARDVSLAGHLAAALAAFFSAYEKRLTTATAEQRLTQEYVCAQLDEQPRITLTFPHSRADEIEPDFAGDADLFDDDRTAAATPADPLQQCFQVLVDRLTDFALDEPKLCAEMPEAMRFFFRGDGPPANASQQERAMALARFHEWFIYERASRCYRETPLATFLARKSAMAGLDAQTRQLAMGLSGNVLGAFEVTAVVKDESLAVTNLFDDARYDVSERLGTHFLEPGSVAIGRIFPLGNGKYTLSGAAEFLEVGAAPALRRDLRKGAAQAGEDFVVSQRDIETVFSGRMHDPGDPIAEAVPLTGAALDAKLGALLAEAQIEVPVAELRARMAVAAMPTEVLSELLAECAFVNQEAVQDTLGHLMALWNDTPRAELGGRSPSEDMALHPPGPIERELLGRMAAFMDGAVETLDQLDPAERQAHIAKLHQQWLNTPLAEFGDRTPAELIADERDAQMDESSPEALAQGVRKVGRNDPCPCGSGKKYGRCCLEQRH